MVKSARGQAAGGVFSGEAVNRPAQAGQPGYGKLSGHEWA